MNVSGILKSIRIPFLLLTPICIYLSYSMSLVVQPVSNINHVSLIFIAALCAHISVNTFNEYFDFKSGLDLVTIKTPFSGGSGALPENANLSGSVLFVAISSLIILSAIGLYLSWLYGPAIFIFGIIGIFIIVAYTPWLNKNPWLALIAPGTGFGLIMIPGAYLVMTGNITKYALAVSIIPFFLANNLLLLNQYPDIEADKKSGRKTFPIVYGTQISNLMYALNLTLAAGVLITLVYLKLLPLVSLSVLVPLVLACYSLYGMYKYNEKIAEKTGYLAANVAATLLSVLVLSITINFY